MLKFVNTVLVSALAGLWAGPWIEQASARNSLPAITGRSGVISSDQCDEFTSCRPWEIKTGPYCARGNKIGLRFFLDMADEERYLRPEAWGGTQRCGVNTGPNTSLYVTFPFCPKVDQLQAFRLNQSGWLAGIYQNSTEERPAFSNSRKRYLRVYGMGTKGDVEFPQRVESSGATVVVDVCPNDELATAITPLLVLNISMNQGKLQYYADFPQPGGTGFSPTCYKNSQGGDVCQLDASMPCIGDEGAKNCAICYTTAEGYQLMNQSVKVWTSYYGTDRTGRQMRSGSNNPLNFRAYSGGGMYTSLSKSLDNVEDGGFNDPSMDDPGTSTASRRQNRHFLSQWIDSRLSTFPEETQTLNPSDGDAAPQKPNSADAEADQGTTGSRLRQHIASLKQTLGKK